MAKPEPTSKPPMTDAEIIAGLRKRPLDKYARIKADRLEELLGRRQQDRQE